MKKRYFATGVALAVVAAVAVLGVGSATANPPGVVDVGKKLANFNIIATPKEWVRRAPMEDGAEVELRPLFELSDFELTAEQKAKYEEVQEILSKKA